MATMAELRTGVRKSFPELNEIKNAELRDKVVEAWAFALSQTEYTSVDEIRASGGPTTPPMKKGTQTDHIRGVTRVALAMADGPRRGLALLDAPDLAKPLARYHLYHAARADLLHREGRIAEAHEAYAIALACCPNSVERAFLEKRLREIQ